MINVGTYSYIRKGDGDWEWDLEEEALVLSYRSHCALNS